MAMTVVPLLISTRLIEGNVAFPGVRVAAAAANRSMPAGAIWKPLSASRLILGLARTVMLTGALVMD